MKRLRMKIDGSLPLHHESINVVRSFHLTKFVLIKNQGNKSNIVHKKVTYMQNIINARSKFDVNIISSRGIKINWTPYAEPSFDQVKFQ